MNYRHLERLRISLTTSAPVFIGSQASLSSRECIFLRDRNVVFVPDIDALVDEIRNRNCMSRYEAFLTASLTPQGYQQSLEGFLRSMNIPVKDDAPWILYRIKCSSDFRQLNGLNLCLRNPQGQPYIPGSTIKGAIRTALISSMATDRDIQEIMNSVRSNPKNRRSGTEEQITQTLRDYMNQPHPPRYGDAVTDIMKAIHISDSAPFERDSTVICKKLEVTVNGEIMGENGRSSASPVFRECIRPGLKTHFYITFDRNILGQSLNMTTLAQKLTEWYRLQLEYLDEFDRNSLKLQALADEGIPIILGGGVGFQQHSLIYRARDKAEMKRIVHQALKEQFTRKGKCTYKPLSDSEPAPYRLKIVKYAGQYYPMGHCRLAEEG